MTETYRPAFDSAAPVKVAGVTTTYAFESPYISYGIPFPEAAAKHATKSFKKSKAYIIASGTLARTTNHLDRLTKALESAGVVVVGSRKGMQSHTLWSEILSIAAECREGKADILITLGAGSITDGAKIIALCLANDITEPSQLARYSLEAESPKEGVKEPTVPLITIPTSLSGGEYFALGGGTDDSTHHKQGFVHPGMGAKLVILDAELTLGTPWYHWLSSGVRAIDHCVETLVSLESTPESDKDAEEGLRLLVPNLLESKERDGKKDETAIEARHKSQMGVLLSMKSIRAGIPMGGSHAIGHQLGPHGVGHGITSCIMNPAVMKWNLKNGTSKPLIKQKQDKVREILWSEPKVAALFEKHGLQKSSADLGDLDDCIIRALGLPRTLKEVDIGKEQIEQLSVRALDDFWAATNPIPLTQATQVKEILLTAAG